MLDAVRDAASAAASAAAPADRPETYVPISSNRLQAAKKAFTTRRVDFSGACRLQTALAQPKTGDLALARVVRLGQHRRLELVCGRRAALYIGDEIIIALGSRYASDQFEGLTPTALGLCQLVAAGGVAASVANSHARMKSATDIVVIGLICDATGKALNLSDFAIRRRPVPVRRPPVTVVLGTSMNAGKTTAVASLIRAAVADGLKVGVLKATGTGSGGDMWSAHDAGATCAYDFTDAGHPATYRIGAAQIETTFASLIAQAAIEGVDEIIVEIADGLLFEETIALVRSDIFGNTVDRIVLAAGDAMGAIASEAMLRDLGRRTDILTGVFTSAPLAAREVATTIATPVIATDALGEMSFHAIWEQSKNTARAA